MLQEKHTGCLHVYENPFPCFALYRPTRCVWTLRYSGDGSSPWTCGGVKMELNALLVLITSVENEAELVLNRSLQENWFNPLHYRSTDGMRRHDTMYKIKLSHFPGWGKQHANVYLYHYSSMREGTLFIYAQVSGPSWFKSMKALETRRR